MFLFLDVKSVVAAGPHARPDWIFSEHDCNPHIPWDHHMCTVSLSSVFVPHVDLLFTHTRHVVVSFVLFFLSSVLFHLQRTRVWRGTEHSWNGVRFVWCVLVHGVSPEPVSAACVWLFWGSNVNLTGTFCFQRMFYGPIVGGLITQRLNFEWAATVQGAMGLLAVSISGSLKLLLISDHFSLL